MSSSVMKSMGVLNAGWGICGFTSTFYAMYDKRPGTQGWLVNATQVFSVLYEITDYLKALQGTNSPLLKAITEFTRSFGPPYDKFTVQGYIEMVDLSSETTRQVLSFGDDTLTKQFEGELKTDELFGIAMPPLAVADYIERQWKGKATITESKISSVGGDAIVGVRDKTDTKKTLYHGLCHYLYRSGGKFYSWGNEYAALADADPNFEICYTIDIKKA